MTQLVVVDDQSPHPAQALAFELPDSDGARATEAIKALMPEVKVVMLTGRTDRQALVRAIDASCAGFVAKTESVDKPIDAIHSAHEGETPSPINELPRLLAQLPPTSRGLGSDLGPQESNKLRLMAAAPVQQGAGQQLHLDQRLSAGPCDTRITLHSGLVERGARAIR